MVDLIGEEASKENPTNEVYDKYAKLEEIIKAIKGSNLYNPVKAAKICLISNVIVPKDFWELGFFKYTGTQCLLTHLEVYCNKMAQVVHDEKLLIHFFQYSLNDATLTWYMRLNKTEI